MKPSKLFAWYQSEVIGVLIFHPDSEELEFAYTEDWQENGFALSPHLPLNNPIPSTNTTRFLQNLFPEGESLEALLHYYRVSRNNFFAITQIIGAETTGALRFTLESEAKVEEVAFRSLTEPELHQRLDEREQLSLAFWDDKLRLSTAGVQDKLPVTILEHGDWGFGEGTLASTHILKFQQQSAKVPHLVLNEYFCMCLAKNLGLKVAEVSLKEVGPHRTLLVKRFDRLKQNDELVERVHIIDGCQALNLSPMYKYERNFGTGRDVANIREGVSLPKLFDFCQLCRVPAQAMLHTLDWVLYNLCIANADSHGKNISYYVGSNGIELAPMYDLVNISSYPHLEQELAMAVGDEFHVNKIGALQLALFADDCKIPRRMVKTRLEKMCHDILNSIDTVEQLEFSDVKLNESERQFVSQLKSRVVENSKLLLASSEALLQVEL